MGLFDFLKKRNMMRRQKQKNKNFLAKPSSSLIEKQQAVLLDDSKSLDERNSAYLAIRDEEERRLNAAYDFNSLEGINSIPVPCREVNGGSFTGRVEYYLRGRCFAQHWDAGRTDLALACLRKANELMYISDMIWKRDDFMRIVYYLRKAGKYDEADAEQKKIDAYFDNKNEIRDSFAERLKSAKELKTDLVEITSSGVCCSECAKYRNRIYSITGKDKRFPTLPSQFEPKTFSYNHVCLSMWPFVYNVMEPSFNCKDIVKYSNRPFVDDRTKQEIAQYNNWQNEMQKAQENQARLEQNRKDYAWLQKNLPDNCPKSLSAFSRMKNGNTAGYQKLRQLAANMGYLI